MTKKPGTEGKRPPRVWIVNSGFEIHRVRRFRASPRPFIISGPQLEYLSITEHTALLAAEKERSAKLVATLRMVASCQSVVKGDCPDLAREAIAAYQADSNKEKE